MLESCMTVLSALCKPKSFVKGDAAIICDLHANRACKWKVPETTRSHPSTYAHYCYYRIVFFKCSPVFSLNDWLDNISVQNVSCSEFSKIYIYLVFRFAFIFSLLIAFLVILPSMLIYLTLFLIICLNGFWQLTYVYNLNLWCTDRRWANIQGVDTSGKTTKSQK